MRLDKFLSDIGIEKRSNEILEYCELLNINETHINAFIETEKLLKRIQKNDINVYATFTECSPMFPLESFEVGVPCLIGKNNDFFEGSELRDYICIDKEDDPKAIYEKIKICLDNKEKIMKLYREWKDNFDIEVKKKVKEFIEA